jgi:hypothetical protein
MIQVFGKGIDLSENMGPYEMALLGKKICYPQ